MEITIKFNTDHLNPGDTDIIFLGSGALSYSWYQGIECREQTDSRDWWITFTDPEDSKIKIALDHAKLIGALKTILEQGGGGLGISTACYEQCVYLVSNIDPEAVDFDADTADQVMQVAAFGKVIYG